MGILDGTIFIWKQLSFTAKDRAYNFIYILEVMFCILTLNSGRKVYVTEKGLRSCQSVDG